MSRIRLAILGSTGSIGRQTLDIVRAFPDRIELVALAANRNVGLLAEQAQAFGVPLVAVADPSAVPAPSELPDATVCGQGPEAVVRLAELSQADVVLNSLVGAAGLRASEAALRQGRRLALANKESLVVGGELLMPLAGGAETLVTPASALVPVDSEHSAIFQCLLGEPAEALRRIWLTASGGPFRGWTRERLEDVTPEQALAHPRWTMGRKITIDSATLMNKGLEAIEAHHLFGVSFDQITVVVHPQSTIHSMTEFADGSVKAHLGATDMHVPIQYALSFPERWEAPIPPVDFFELARLDFGHPDPETFRCLGLAIAAGTTGGTMPAVMNAANEVAVAAFLDRRLSFTGIDRLVETVMGSHESQRVESFEQLETVDAWARSLAETEIGRA